MDSEQNVTYKIWGVMVALLLIDSMHLIFGRMLGSLMTPIVSSFYVLGIATVEVGVFLAVRGEVNWRVLSKNLWFFLTIGFLVAGATVMSYTSVTLIDAGTASLLGRMSTVITLGLSYFWLKESLSRNELLGAILCIVGAFIISFQPSNVFRIGSLFVLGAVTFYALHIAIVKRYGDGIEFSNFFFFRVGATAFFLTIFMGVSGNVELPPSARAWFFLALTATVDVVVSRWLYYWALRQMRLGIHTIALTLTPILTILWSLVFFRESPTRQGLLGGIVVLIGILIVAWDQQKNSG